MFDDSNSGRPGSPPVADHLGRHERRVYEHVHEHGPIGRPSLQADLYPYDRRTFERAIGFLTDAGYISIDGRRVSVAVDLSELARPRTVDVADLGGVVTFRPATKTDVSELLTLVREHVRDDHYGGAHELVHRLETDGRLHSRRGSSERTVYVAEHEGRIRGWSRVSARDTDGGRDAELVGGVADCVRRKGVGSRLHRYTVDWSRRRGYDRTVHLVPADDAETFQFLRARGWAVDGVHPGEEGMADRLRLVNDLRSC